jgi:hypothetical protein
MVGHCPEGITYEQAIAAGMTCFEHLTGIAEGHMGGSSLSGLRMGSIEAMQTVVDHLDRDAIRRLASMLAEKEIWNCPTVVVWQGSALEEETAMSNPLLRYESAATLAGWNPANDFRFKSSTLNRTEWLAVARARIEAYLEVVSILHEEGAPLILGTDTPNPFVIQGFSIHDELDNLVRAGLSPYEALRAGTVDAARFLREDDAWGSIAEGKRADLVLLNENPLENVSTVRRPQAIFVNSFFFDRADLDRLLANREAEVAPTQAIPGELPALASGGTVVREGVLGETMAGAAGGRIRFRQARLTSRAEVIDEVYAGDADGLQTWGGQTRLHVELTPSLDVAIAAIQSTSPLGSESCEIQATDAGDYEIALREIDGFECSFTLPGPLRPSDDLGLAALLPLLDRQAVGTHRAMGLVGSRPTEYSMSISRENVESWRVHTDKAGTTVDQVFRLSSNGDMIRMEQETWRGLRVVSGPPESPSKNGERG